MMYFSAGRRRQGEKADQHARGKLECCEQVHKWAWKDAEAEWVNHYQEYQPRQAENASKSMKSNVCYPYSQMFVHWKTNSVSNHTNSTKWKMTSTYFVNRR